MFFNRGYKKVIKVLNQVQNKNLKHKFNFESFVITWFFLGLSPIAPGTLASLSTYPIYHFLRISSTSYNELELGFFILAAIFSALGLFYISRFQSRTFSHDHKSIVIDEIVGQLLTFAISCNSLFKFSASISSYVGIKEDNLSFLIGLCLFRFFDIKKPFFIKTIDRKMKGATAVILDDVVAAIFAGFSIIILYKIYDFRFTL